MDSHYTYPTKETRDTYISPWFCGNCGKAFPDIPVDEMVLHECPFIKKVPRRFPGEDRVEGDA